MSDTIHFHPFAVHFPIALSIIGFTILSLYMIMRQQKQLFTTAFFLIVVAIIGLGMSYISGEFFTPELEGKMHDAKEIHEFYAKLSSFTALGGLIFWIFLNKRKPTLSLWVFYISILVATILIIYTGYLGGTLVYEQMIPQELLQ